MLSKNLVKSSINGNNLQTLVHRRDKQLKDNKVANRDNMVRINELENKFMEKGLDPLNPALA